MYTLSSEMLPLGRMEQVGVVWLLLLAQTEPAQSWELQLLREGGFAVVAIILYIITKKLWQRYSRKEDQQVQGLTKTIETLQKALEEARNSSDGLLKTENTSKQRALQDEQKKREEELQRLRAESIKLRDQLEDQLEKARTECDRLRKAHEIRQNDLYEQINRMQEQRVTEAMNVVHAVEAQKEANEILERMVRALAESNEYLRKESSELREALTEAAIAGNMADLADGTMDPPGTRPLQEGKTKL